jgi:hypothetical protein
MKGKIRMEGQGGNDNRMNNKEMLKNTEEMRERNKSVKGTKEWKNRDKNDNRM